MTRFLFRAVVALALGLGIFYAIGSAYQHGGRDQQSHDQRCLATDAAWFAVAECIGGQQ